LPSVFFSFGALKNAWRSLGDFMDFGAMETTWNPSRWLDVLSLLVDENNLPVTRAFH
jgi:hypothetical protein